MSDAVTLAIIGVISAFVSGGVTVAVGAWADARKKRQEAALASDGRGFDELTKVRAEYLARIERLEKRLDEKDAEMRALHKELGDARVIVAQQAARIADLEQDIAQMHRERTS